MALTMCFLSDRLFTHLIPPSEEEKERGKERGEGEVFTFHHKNVAISVETWQGTGGLDPLHLSRPFREIRVPTAHLPIFCKLQSCTIINECSLLFQRFINIGQHVMKKKHKHNMSFRDLLRPSISLRRTTPWLKQSIEVFLVAHMVELLDPTTAEYIQVFLDNPVSDSFLSFAADTEW